MALPDEVWHRVTHYLFNSGRWETRVLAHWLVPLLCRQCSAVARNTTTHWLALARCIYRSMPPMTTLTEESARKLCRAAVEQGVLLTRMNRFCATHRLSLYQRTGRVIKQPYDLKQLREVLRVAIRDPALRGQFNALLERHDEAVATSRALVSWPGQAHSVVDANGNYTLIVVY